jgi:DnaA family protein
VTDPSAAPAQIPLPFPAPKHFTFATFRAGANREAVEQLHRAAAGTDPRNVYLWGAPGTGRTHLLHAACNACSAAGRRALYLSMLMRAELAPAALEELEQYQLVCIDDLELAAGDHDWELALFHLFNRMREAGHPLLMTGASAPQGIPLQVPDLKSRLSWDMVYRLAPLDEQERFAALRERALLRGMEMPDDVVDFLSRRISRDLRSMLDWLDRLDEESLAAKKKLTVPFVRSLIGE